mgnify:CR=1 FL=1
MGREERRNRAVREIADRMTKEAMDEGLIIKAGWVGFLLMVYPNGTSDAQREELRAAFYGGAHHLYASIMNVIGPGDEPTPDDVRRMALIDHELQAFLHEYKRRHGISDDLVPPEGKQHS